MELEGLRERPHWTENVMEKIRGNNFLAVRKLREPRKGRWWRKFLVNIITS